MPVIRLMDMAECIIEEMAQPYRYSPEDIRIEEIGLRPGEKMYEELMTEDEAEVALELANMFIIPNAFINPHTYPDARPASKQSYHSHNTEPISKKEIGEMLRSNHLLLP